MLKVSTIIPAYNAERTIAQAVDSALSQDFDGHEVIVVNDGSTDSTVSILEEYGRRIHVVTQPNRGVSAARNAGVRQSTGKYLAFLDSDDVFLPGKFETMISALERNPLASLAFSEYRHIDNNGVECGASSIGHAPSIAEMQRLLPILPSTWVLPRAMFDRAGGFCEAFKGAQGGEDSWMLLLLRELGDFVYVSEKLTLYRLAESGKAADKYSPSLSTFGALVTQRYGTKGKALIRNNKNLHCRWMLCKAADQMNNGDRLGALRTLARVVKLRPAYFFGSEFRQRLLLPQNLKRLRDLAAAPGRIHD